MITSFTCAICQHEYSELLLNDHHIHPTDYGGSDEPANRVKLCAGCHQALHYLAYRIYKGAGGAEAAADQYLRSIGAPREAFNTLMAYATKVAQCMAESNLGTVQSNTDKRVTIHLRNEHKELLKMLAKPQGLSAYIEVLLLRHLRDRMPALADAINNDIRRR